MIDILPFAVVGLLSFAAGGGTVAWLKSRPTTTRAMAMRALAAEFALVAKLPSVADQEALVAQEKQNEALAAQVLAAAVAKVNGQ